MLHTVLTEVLVHFTSLDEIVLLFDGAGLLLFPIASSLALYAARCKERTDSGREYITHSEGV